MTKLYCLDSMVVIWGIKGETSPGQEGLARLAHEFFSRSTDKFILPTPVLAEVLAKVPVDLHNRFMRLAESKFEIRAFDTVAAVKYAQIWHEREAVSKKLVSEGVSRQVVKMDCQIVAIALAEGADQILSYDSGLSKFAKGVIPVTEIPIEPYQIPLAITASRGAK